MAVDVREKLVKLLDDFHRDLSPFAGNEKLYVVDDNVEQADYLISHGVTVQEWISVKDRLPEDRGDVLVVAWWHEKWQTKIGWYNDVAKTFHILTTEEGDLPWWYVTHWMPLPHPPIGE